MKKAILSSVFIVFCILSIAQVPEYFNYQVVVRDGVSNNPLTDQDVSFKMIILKGSISGTEEYSEYHNANTGDLGIVNLVIGNGTDKTGTISAIDWGADSYYLKVMIDKTGGTDYVEMGTTQLLSVPYAMHAKSVASYDETDPQFTLSPANGITSGNITDWNTTHSWGDHALQGYLTSFTESDPKVGLNSTDYLSKWDGAALISSTIFDNGKVGIGTESPVGYLEVTDKGDNTPYNLIVLGQTATPNRLRLSSGTNYGIISVGPSIDESKGLTIRHSSGYIGMGTPDPSTKLDVNGVITATGGNSTNWNSAYSWGNHADGGYLKSYTETDPNFLASPASGITSGNIANWNTITWSEIINIPVGFSDGVDNDTWTNNTKSSAGIVTAGSTNYNTFWKTDGTGNPAWRYLTASDIPDLDWTKITTGKPTTLTGYGITDGVNTSGNQTINGNKTFTGTTTVPTPVNATDAATKAYVDKLLSIIQTIQVGVNDWDGNRYKVIIIGDQVWMAENLKTTKYNDGVSIPLVTDYTAWSNLTTPGYCWYDNNEANKDTYGALYNWHTVNTGILCPAGWHVPSDDEWTTMENYLISNGFNYDGTTTENKIAKSLASTSGWTSSSTTGAAGNTDYPSKRNATGFTALPGGLRYNNGGFNFINYNGIWWSATEYDAANAWFRNLSYSFSNLDRPFNYKEFGFSVRCIKDE